MRNLEVDGIRTSTTSTHNLLFKETTCLQVYY